MKKIKNMVIVLENCESETILAEDIVKFRLIKKESQLFEMSKAKPNEKKLRKKSLQKKISAKIIIKNSQKYQHFGRKDVTHIYVVFEDLTEQRYVVNWGIKDCMWSESSLQKSKINLENNTVTWTTDFKK